MSNIRIAPDAPAGPVDLDNARDEAAKRYYETQGLLRQVLADAASLNVGMSRRSKVDLFRLKSELGAASRLAQDAHAVVAALTEVVERIESAAASHGGAR